MINEEKLRSSLIDYKRDFDQRWENEKFKWEAVKCFQDNWDLNASDFASMLKKSLSETSSLLTSYNNFPEGMIEGFAESAPEEVRRMFGNLYDESQDIWVRMNEFKSQSAALLEKFGNGAKNHYQSENVISIYLWLKYPDKYYIYKFSEVRTVSKNLESSYFFKKGAYENNIREFYKFYDELCTEIKKDTELMELFRNAVTEECYPDPELKTLTVDIGFYISRNEHQVYYPLNYTPGLSKEDWSRLISDREIFTSDSMKIMKRMLDFGGFATCRQLSKEYGNTSDFYSKGSSFLAERIADKTDCPIYKTEDGNIKWWPILYLAKNIEKEDEESCKRQLREELKEALQEVDLDEFQLYENNYSPDPDVAAVNYWLYAPGEHAGEWEKFYKEGIAALGWDEVGDLRDFGSMTEIKEEFRSQKGGNSSYKNSVNALWQFSRIMKTGDVIFVKCGHSEILGRGIVESDYEYDDSLEGYPHIRRVKWTHKGTWKTAENFPVKTLTNITDKKGMVTEILALFETEDEDPEPAEDYPAYTVNNFLKEVYISEEEYDKLRNLLAYKKNIILQGAPGVGKTFLAKRLAYSIMGVKDVNRVQMIQFHQSYSYEDFIMGFRPAAAGGFELKKGVFYTFCRNAMEDNENDYFFIIDEINRGNLSKIFGELFVLLENDKRGSKNTIQLLYSDELFYVPENVYIIGMMNTADRSLALMDYALRRRFAFYNLKPQFSSEGFRIYQEGLNNPEFDRLIDTIIQLNEEISSYESLGEGFCIGHSYFCNLSAESQISRRLSNIVEYEIIPLLKEYWFDEPEKIKEWSSRLRSALK